MSNGQIKKLIDYLLEQKLITQEQHTLFLDQNFPDLDSAGRFIRREVYLSAEKWTEVLSNVLNVKYANLIGRNIPAETLNIIPQDLAENYQIVVFDKDPNSINVGMVDPTNFKAMEALEFIARKQGLKINYHIISSESFRASVKQYESLGEEVGEALGIAEELFAPKQELEELGPSDNVDEVIKSAPVTKIISVVLRHAIEGGASDIHIEPVGEQSKVRYRIDGILHNTIVLPIYVHAALVSRIKVMANLKLDETRVPQDGRIRLKVHKKDVDFRISTIPLVNAEKVVMRILATPDKAPTFEDLGFMGLQKKLAEANIKKPNGMYLVTGPTGSGKSTTLYAVLDALNSEEVNITTLEDPVEYYIKGVNQSQIRPEVKFTFASGLRSLLRQDPDIIMVGEIRDNETAGLAIHAGLTGHFILSTLHTNSAIGAVPRLFDMKVEPFLLSSTLNLIIAQRLVRRICEDCKEEETLPPDTLKKVETKLKAIPEAAFYGGVKKGGPLKFYRGKGCTHCGDTGYKGRIAIVEAVEVNSKMKQLVANGFPKTEVDKELANQNFIYMEQDGLIKTLVGLTTVEEVFRASETEI